MTGGEEAQLPGRNRRWPVLAVAGILALVAGGVVVVEVVGRRVVERTAAEMLADQGVDGATVELGGSWWEPVVLRALLGGSIDEVTVRVEGVDVAGMQVARANYVLEGLAVEPDLAAGSLGVSAIERGSFRLLLAPAAVGDAMGVDVSLVDGRLVVGPDDEPAKLRVDGDELVLESPYLQRNGHPPRVTALSARLLPCTPEVALVDSYIALACEGDRLPAVLDTSLGEPVADLPAPPELEPPMTAERNDGD